MNTSSSYAGSVTHIRQVIMAIYILKWIHWKLYTNQYRQSKVAHRVTFLIWLDVSNKDKYYGFHL